MDLHSLTWKMFPHLIGSETYCLQPVLGDSAPIHSIFPAHCARFRIITSPAIKAGCSRTCELLDPTRSSPHTSKLQNVPVLSLRQKLRTMRPTTIARSNIWNRWAFIPLG